MPLTRIKYTITGLEVETGLDRRALRKLLADIEPAEISGKKKTVKKWTVSQVVDALKRQITRGLNPIAEKARLDKARADKTELEYKKLLGALIPVDEAVTFLEKLIVATRAHLLAIPTKAAPSVTGCKTIQQTKAALTDAIDDSLTELSSLDPLEMARSSDVENMGATAEVDAQPVGRRRKGTQPRSKRRARKMADR